MGDIALYRSKEILSMELNNIVSWRNYEENNVTLLEHLVCVTKILMKFH